MMRFAVWFAVALLAAPAVADEKKPDFDARQLEGKWKIVAGSRFGKKSDEKALESEVTITKDTITIKAATITHVFRYVLDKKADPIHIVLTGIEGPSKAFIADGLIELKGDELKLCYAMPNHDRPTSLESTRKEKSNAFVMKREK